MTKITIGARGSKLSLAYVAKVRNLLLQEHKNLKENDITIQTIKTSGDINQNIKLSEIGGKNLFCKEIEEKLLKDEIDIAVHSLKDMDSIENNSLLIGAFIKRNDFRDVIVSKKIKKLEELNNQLKIGSSSRRRELQLKKINKKITIENIRGNIDTRIRKIDEDELDGIILAAAGLKSLNLDNEIAFTFETDQILPAVGQGVIAVQCKKNNNNIKNLLKKINHNETEICAKAERSLLRTIGGDCETAIGGLATIKDNRVILKAQLFSDKGEESFEYEATGNFNEAILLGKKVGKKVLLKAGTKFKKK
tara:strand:- start:533 stop:1453 length:921 start_codon:yes stop_codon:yes gene_type:complete